MSNGRKNDWFIYHQSTKENPPSQTAISAIEQFGDRCGYVIDLGCELAYIPGGCKKAVIGRVKRHSTIRRLSWWCWLHIIKLPRIGEGSG